MAWTQEEEHILERMWEDTVEKDKVEISVKQIAKPSQLEAMAGVGLLVFCKGKKVKLTAKGKKAAMHVIRRHRLAERLMFDVLNIKKTSIEGPSCKFEHAIDDEVEENICTLLGHPTECPHGKSIPSGQCCKKHLKTVDTIVSPLSELENGTSGRIAYLVTKNHSKLQKLMALGVLPGKNVSVIQTFPSHVFKLGNTQIVIDMKMAKDIFVKVR